MPTRASRSPRGPVVEFVRLTLVALFTAGGWRIAQSLGASDTRLLLYTVLGSALGYVIGGIIGRRTVLAVSAAERDLRKVPGPELLAGAVGLILGLVIAVLVSVLLFRLPPAAAYPTAAFVTLSLGYVGYRVGRAKHGEMPGMQKAWTARAADEVNVVDTSALIDGRVLDVVRAGFLGGRFVVTRGVLQELQSVADASDSARRLRGQRGLDVLRELRAIPGIQVEVQEEDPPAGDVDAHLVRLARERQGAVVTTDANLARVAGALEVPVRSVNQLVSALRPSVLPGEEVTLRLTKEGRERGQGVGFLEDGTMVVVDGGGERIGSDVRVTVTNVLQTSSGRMVFAELDSG